MTPFFSQTHIIALIAALGLGACEQQADSRIFTGYVEAEFVYVAAPDAGWLVETPVREGDTVDEGGILFELDKDRQKAELAEAADLVKEADAEARNMATGARREEIDALEAELEEASATLELARAERVRWTRLGERGFASKSRVDQVVSEYETAAARVRNAQANIRVAKLAERDAAREAAAAKRDAAAAALAQAEWDLQERTVNAQVGGRIEEVFHRTGEFVTAGSPVVAILPENAIKVRFFVPQARLSDVDVGTEVNVVIDNRPDPLPAHVTFIAREAEFTPPVIYSTDSREKLVFLVEAHFSDPAAARPGQPVDVRLP